MRKVTKVWKTKDGQKIRICDMTDSHLKHTIAMLKRLGYQHQYDVCCSPPYFLGEMAQDMAEDMYQEVCSMSEEELACEVSPLYKDLVEERERRLTSRTHLLDL